MRPRSYIGVTGIMNRAEADALMSVVPRDSGVLVMLGLLMSSKSIRGEPNKWPKRYPKLEGIGKIFPDHPNALNLIHFNTKSPERLYDDMCLAQDLAGPNCHGFQLNIAWPDKKVLRQYKKTLFRHRTIVLQCGGKALDEMGRNPERIAERVREYGSSIDYVLIDPSGGFGMEFNGTFAEECLDALASAVPDVGLGIAGGLQSRNVRDKLWRFLAAHEFSWDAEGRLRTAEDDLDIDAAMFYVRNSIPLYKYMYYYAKFRVQK
jgi:hypothetical protein